MKRGLKTLGELELVTEECITCGVLFAIPTKLQDKLIENHQEFYCPNGHGQHYAEKTQLEKEVEHLSTSLDTCRILKDDYQKESKLKDYQARYWKGRVTKMRKAGIPPRTAHGDI